MSIRPLDNRVVVQRLDQDQDITKGGIVIPDTAKEKPMQGKIVAAGAGKRLDNGEICALSVKVGDVILFGKYAGTEVKLDGQELIIMREDDILGIIEG